jgi:hypothetical protein
MSFLGPKGDPDHLPSILDSGFRRNDRVEVLDFNFHIKYAASCIRMTEKYINIQFNRKNNNIRR